MPEDLIKVFSALIDGQEVYSVYWDRSGGWMKFGDPAEQDRGILGTTFEQRVDELRFYNTDLKSPSEILAVVPIVPSKQTIIKLEPSGSPNAVLSIDTQVRCFLGAEPVFLPGKQPIVDSMIRFTAKVSLDHVKDLEDEPKMPCFSDFGFYQSAKPEKVTFRSFFQNYRQYFHKKGIRFKLRVEIEPKPIDWFFVASVGFNTSDWNNQFSKQFLQVSNSGDWMLWISFSITAGTIMGPQFSIVFGAKETKTTFKGFGLPVLWSQLPNTQQTNASKFLPDEYKGYVSEFRISQRLPKTSMEAFLRPKESPFWVVDIAFPLAKEFFSLWKKYVCDPLSTAMSTVDRASKLSGIPLLAGNKKISDCPLGFATYSVIDRKSPQYGKHIFPISLSSAGCYEDISKITPASYFTFPSLITEYGKPLRIQGQFMTSMESRNETARPEEARLGVAFRHTKESGKSQMILLGSLRFAPFHSDDLTDSEKPGDSLVNDSSSIHAMLRRKKTNSTDKAEPEFFPPDSEITEALIVEDTLTILGVSDIKAAGQDSMPEQRYAQQFERSREAYNESVNQKGAYEIEEPIVFQIFETDQAVETTQQAPFLLSVEEALLDEKNHTVTLNLYRRSDTTNKNNPSVSNVVEKLSYFIIDRTPFFIGRVDVDVSDKDRLSGESSEIANLSSRTGETWEVSYGANPYVISLPPQGIGETAEKRRGPDDVVADIPIDFRFCPPTRLTLQGNYFNQRFAEVPWNFRRLFGYPGQRDPGCKIQSGTFELFYGLKGKIFPLSDGSLHRISEINSQIGSLPGPVPAQSLSIVSETQKQKFNLLKESWATYYKALKSRLSILEVRSGADDTMELLDGVQYELRDSAELKFPVLGRTDLLAYVPEHLRGSNGLAGGLSWVFDSAVIYDSLWADPQAVQSKVSNLKFSALGGWATQTATFNKGLIRITTETTMGRTHYIKVEVYGRIGICWNNAKHVIIYERSVLPSRQFYSQQDYLKGIPVLRKTQEYIEVEVESPRESVSKTAFFKAAEFKKEFKRINVDSAWGQDLYANVPGLTEAIPLGWKVPLWNPSAYPADVYPKPPIFALLENAAQQDDSQQFDDPEKFCFFFLSRKMADTQWPNMDYSKPSAWPEILDVDFPLDASTACEDPSDAKQLTGDTSKLKEPDPYPANLSNFTFTLKSTSSKTNVVATKASEAISANIRNITLMRGSFDSSWTRTGPAKLLAKESIESNCENLSNALGSLQDGAKEVAEILTESKNALSNELERLKKTLESGSSNTCQQLSERATDQLERQMLKLESRFLDALDSYASGNGDVFTSDWPIKIHDVIEKAQDAGGTESEILERAKGELKAFFNISNGELAKLKKRICALAGFLDSFEIDGASLQDSIKSFSAITLAELVSNTQNAIDALDPVDPKTIETLRTRINSFREICVSALKECSASIQFILRPFLDKKADSFALAVEAIENILIDSIIKLDTLLAQLLKDINDQTTTIEEAKKKLKDELNSVNSTVTAQFEVVIRVLNSLVNEATRQAQNSSLQIINAVAQLNAKIEKAIDKSLTDLLEENELELNTCINAALRECINRNVIQWDEVKKELLDKTRSSIKALCEEFAKHAKDILKQIVSCLNTAPIEYLERQLKEGQKTLAEARADIAVFRAKLLSQIDRAENAVLQSTPVKLLSAAESEAHSSLKLLRAFGNAPDVSGLAFNLNREQKKSLRLAYNYFSNQTKEVAGKKFAVVEEILDGVGVTPCFANPKEFAASKLNPMQLQVATNRIRERVEPYKADLFELKKSILHLAQFDCRNLFPGVMLPGSAGENIKITQGVEKKTLTAWMMTNMDVGYSNNQITMLNIAGATVKISDARFQALSRSEIKAGQPPHQEFSAAIAGDFIFGLGGTTFLTIEKARLISDASKKIKFDVKAKNIKLQPVLRFLSDLVNKVSTSDNGFRTELIATGIRSSLYIPMPDIQLGTFSIANLSLGFIFELAVLDDFQFKTQFSLASQQRPFTLTVFVLGGAGWVAFSLSVKPATREITTKLSVFIALAASLAIRLGPISGGISAYFGIRIEYQATTGQSSELSFALVIIFNGHVDVLGIASADVCLSLEAEYSSSTGVLVGRGRVTLSIEICWCFTLHVNKSVSYKFGNPKKNKKKKLGSAAAHAGAIANAALLADDIENEDENRVFARRSDKDLERLADECIAMYEW